MRTGLNEGVEEIKIEIDIDIAKAIEYKAKQETSAKSRKIFKQTGKSPLERHSLTGRRILSKSSRSGTNGSGYPTSNNRPSPQQSQKSP